MTGARRRAALAVVVLVAAVLSAVFAVRAARSGAERLVPTAATVRDEALDLGAVLDEPHLVFRSTAPGPTYGRLAAVPLEAPRGGRSVSGLSCDRVHATARAAICLTADRGAITRYRAELLTDRLRPDREVPIQGIPSRARLSPDGSWAATTTFVSGHGYGTLGFSTETRILERATGRGWGNLERTFTTLIEGRRVTAADLNVWGVTFAPGARPSSFYATVATGGRTWLVRGDLRARTLTALRRDAECPSLSPDGRRLVYKKRAGSPISWRYHVLDLRSGREHPLAEARSVDDQAEWLDDDHVLYGLPAGERSGGAGTAGRTDVWVADVRESGAAAGGPRLFLPDAWSPSVVRTPGE